MKDNRKTVRHVFGVEQRIAKIVNREMPSLEDFESVRCADISPAGIAFFQQTRPDFEELVVSLGVPPDNYFLMAKVIHSELIEICDSLVFRVGCRFTGSARLVQETQTLVLDSDEPVSLFPAPQMAE